MRRLCTTQDQKNIAKQWIKGKVGAQLWNQDVIGLIAEMMLEDGEFSGFEWKKKFDKKE